jgi:ankyrin repeat protein
MATTISGRFNIAKMLVDRGVDIEARKSKHGPTALAQAIVFRRFFDIAEMLVRQGAELEISHNDEPSALMWASKYGHLNLAEMLVDHGAEMEIWHNREYTALKCACMENHSELASKPLRGLH